MEHFSDYAALERPVEIKFVAGILGSDAFKAYLAAEERLIREVEEQTDPVYFPLSKAIGVLGKAVNKFTVAKFMDWGSGTKKS